MWWELTRIYAVQAGVEGGVGGGRGANGFLGREVNCSAFTCYSAPASYSYTFLAPTCTYPPTHSITANIFHFCYSYHTPSLTRSAVSHNVLTQCIIIPFATTATSADSQFRPSRPRRELRQIEKYNAKSTQWPSSTQSTSAEAMARKKSSLRAKCENPISPPTPSWIRGPIRMASVTSTAKLRQMKLSTWTGDAS